MRLSVGNKGNDYIVQEVELERAVEMRLEALGMTTGTKIHLVNRKRNGSMVIQVRGTRLALGSGITKNIYVNYLPEDTYEIR